MDFLDPRKKGRRRWRLILSYFVMAAVVASGTFILVYSAFGYSLNTKSGDITQNGLLFVDSKPGGATIYLNSKPQGGQTSARLNLPAGQYNLLLKRAGYRDWQRDFTLKKHGIGRFAYPFLIPTTPQISTLQVYSFQPGLLSQSPDRRWLLLQTASLDSRLLNFDVYDTTSLDQPKTSLAFPASLFSGLDRSSQLKEVEWSSDNRHLLVSHDFAGGSEFIMLDREAPASSFNLNAVFGLTPSAVSLRDKKFNQFYIYDQTAQTIRLANLSDHSVGPALISGVLTFKSYGPDLINYATDQNQPADKAAIKIWDRGRSYLLSQVPRASTYLMDAAQYQGHWYYVAGSSSASRLNIYKDPLNFLANVAIGRALPLTFLDLLDSQKVSISTNARFIGIQAGQNFATYDIETETKFSYQVAVPLASPMHWMDGHRYIGQSQGNILIADYDGTNQQLLGTSLLAGGGYFDRSYNHLLSLAGIDNSSSTQLLSIDMRAGTDLPH